MSRVMCTACNYIGESRTISRGSIDAEVILWFCFLIPGLIYSIWRAVSKREVCPCCGQESCIPANSPRAKFLKERLAQQAANASLGIRPPSRAAIETGRTVGRLIGRLLR
jgi:hypothetical protein